jgi:hypothetical protein
LSWRALILEHGIQNMLGDRSLTNKLYEHPFVKSLGNIHRKPSYIPSDVFSSALFDILTESALELRSSSLGGKHITDREKFKTLYEYVVNSQALPTLSRLFSPILNASDGSILKAHIKLEDFYNDMVEGLSSSYRRRAQIVVLMVAIQLATVFNVDAIALFNYSFSNIITGGFPIGWTPSALPFSASGWVVKITGILLTALLVAVLSPFWFTVQRMFSQINLGRQQRDVSAAIDVIKKTESQNVQEVAASQIELLDEYHKIVLDQSRKSFVSALAAAIVGLGFFLGAVISIASTQKIDTALISVIAGALVEVISGINFYLYAKTTVQMGDFQSRLDMTQRFLLANSICENLEGEFKQNTRSQLVLKIVDAAVAKVEPQTEKST